MSEEADVKIVPRITGVCVIRCVCIVVHVKAMVA